MVDIEKLLSNIRAGVKNGNMKRLRKSQWTSEPLRVAIPKANDILKHKYIIKGPIVHFNFKIEECKGRVVGMPKEEYYYYQIIRCDHEVFWDSDKLSKFILDMKLEPIK